MVNGGRFGVAGPSQRGGSKCISDPFDIGEYRRTDAAYTVASGEHWCTDAAHAVGEHGRTDATNALVVGAGRPR